MKKVEITWRDSQRYTYQMHSSDAVEIVIIKTCGYLVSQDKKQVVICQDIIGDDIRGVATIPIENVVKIHKL